MGAATKSAFIETIGKKQNKRPSLLLRGKKSLARVRSCVRMCVCACLCV
jgi:hypothetical protein